MPWTLVGLTAGAWELRDPLAPATQPAPGVAEAQAPLAWMDSASVVVGEGAAWAGFGSGLAVAQGWLRPPGARQPRAVFTSVSGQTGLDRTGLFLARGDAAHWTRLGAVTDERGAIGDLAKSGYHLWTIASGLHRGAHAFEASFAQRGAGEGERLGIAESARGQSGAIGWNWTASGDSLGVRFSRGLDGRELVPVVEFDPPLAPVRRDASENVLELVASRSRTRLPLALRLALRESRVVQVIGTAAGPRYRTEWSDRSWWFAASTSRPFGEGTLDLVLGAGHDRAPSRPRDRDVIAPSLAWRVRRDDANVRVFLERVATPVWSDLDPLTAPFLQHTWAGGFEASKAGRSPLSGSVLVLAGRTANRATLLRSPLRAQSLYFGWQMDERRYNFLLLQPTLAANLGAAGADASAYLVGRGRVSDQPRVDPSLGARAGAWCAFKLFQGDMGVKLRGQAAYVGVRETDLRNALVLNETLPGYASLSASAAITLGDATVTFRMDGLENERHPETWADIGPDGYRLALDSGKQYRFELVWPLFN